VFYVRERQLRRLDLTTQKDVPLIQLRGNKQTMPYYSMHYNPAENAFLLVTKTVTADNSTYDFYKVSVFDMDLVQ
jgi:coatomer protein complex subunit alpha (xenin)